MNNQGFTVVELLISSLISVTVSLYALNTFKNILETKLTLKKLHEQIYQKERLTGIIRTATRYYNQHGFKELTPKILSASDLNRQLDLSSGKQAIAGSNGLHFIDLSWKDYVIVTIRKEYAEIGCHQQHGNVTSEDSTFIGLTLTGYNYLSGSSQITELNPVYKSCRRYFINNVPNLFNFKYIPVESAKVFIPIKSEKLIYLDTEKSLRLLSLRGLAIKENSVLFTGVKSIKFEVKKDPPVISYRMKFNSGQRVYQDKSTSNLSGKDQLNFLLNLGK